MAKSPALQSNVGVDYVVVYRYSTADKKAAENTFASLIARLSSVGLETEVRTGDNHSLLIFLRMASEEHMLGEVYRSRVRDWIHGVRTSQPASDTKASLEEDPLIEAERLRIIYQLITNPENEGGAGITPKKGEWENVESVFALHDHVYNKEWIKKWSTQWLLQPEDLDDIRNRMGSKVAIYFAFTQSYFMFLLFPAVIGLGAWALLGHFSPTYAVLASLWSVVFTEYWKHQEHDLAIRWGVRGVTNIDTSRREFRPVKEATDPVTGERQQIFPATTRLQRQILVVPFTIAAVVILGSMIASCFAIEIFISEVYTGPFKGYLVFLPTVLLTTGLPMLTGFLTTLATRLTDYENYETEAQHEQALTSKVFVLNFLTSYLAICLTAFVYVPFGSIVVPYLNVFSIIVRPFASKEEQLHASSKPSHFAINPDRLRKQFIYFTVTAQIVNFAMEVVVPYLKRQGFLKFKQIQSQRAKSGGGAGPFVGADDSPEEKEFLARVRNEAELTVYDVYDDLREMVVQFGYLTMFSVIWPLAPVSFLINNWIELRADAIKICVEMQRPTPWRADSIGPWLDALSFLTWFGSLTMSALVYMFSNDGLGPDGNPSEIKGWGLLLAVFFSEHIYLFARWGVSTAIAKIDSPGRQKVRRDRFLTRQRYFEESLAHTRQLPAVSEGMSTASVTREMLEEQARQGSLTTATSQDRFWSRQRGWKESVQVGRGLIERSLPDEKDVKAAKKEL
ncbi:Calcium-activated chloride channel [Acrodontium crateriforme]|uniref:Calcium-activated chloride channel n=1 Tax=Acrodontium crateriforme TaxID=150365 RepID=A0AAQ3M3E2_9PEZI|nr:Calcium-activated chloride channel [Acrodontium crateriforme]